MYLKVLKKEPSNPEHFVELGKYVVVFESENSKDSIADIKGRLPSDITIYDTANKTNKGRICGVFKIKGVAIEKKTAAFFKQNNDFRLYAIRPASKHILSQIDNLDDAKPDNSKIKELEEKLKKLEKKLEGRDINKIASQQKLLARQRMRKDNNNLTRTQLQEIETLSFIAIIEMKLRLWNH